MEITDKTGEPRSDEDLLEALTVIQELMINPPMSLPKLAINLANIKDLLMELVERRIRDASRHSDRQ